MRDASMNPTAATVLPAPVACSNQKRRSAPGSSGASSICSSSSSASASSQSWGSSSGARVSLSSSSSATAPFASPLPSTSSASADLAVAVAVAPVASSRALRALELGGHRGERSRERVDLVLVELGSVEQLGRLLGEQTLEAEQQRIVAAPLHRWAPRLRRRARVAPCRPRDGERCRAPGRRSSRLRAGSALGRSPARDRVQTRSVRQPRSRQRRWYLPWAKGIDPCSPTDPCRRGRAK